MPLNRLILGSGKHWPKEDNEAYKDTFLDIMPFDRVDVVHDLNKTPWPFEDDSFEEIAAHHVIEHLDSVIDFMNEAWRILIKGGSIYITTPHADKENFDLMFSDPTHKHWLTKHSFINYFTLSGVNQFGYTDRPWSLWHIEVKNGILIVHAEPIKRKI